MNNKTLKKAVLALTAGTLGAFATGLAGCELLVDFDRTLIDSGLPTDGSLGDVITQGDAQADVNAADTAADTTTSDAPGDAPGDSPTDAPADVRDGGTDAPSDAADAADAPADSPADAPSDASDAAADADAGLSPAAFSITGTAAYGNEPIGTPTSGTTFTVQNTGQTTSTAITISITGANASDYSIGTNNCNGATLAANATCTVTVIFNPAVVGAKAAVLNAQATGATTGTLNLTGTGIGLGIAPSSNNFNTVTIGQSSADVVFTVTNTLTTASGTITATVGGANGTEFVLAMNGDACTGQTLAANNGTCTITLHFSPTGSAGARSGTITVTGTPGGTAVAQLSGTAQ